MNQVQRVIPQLSTPICAINAISMRFFEIHSHVGQSSIELFECFQGKRVNSPSPQLFSPETREKLLKSRLSFFAPKWENERKWNDGAREGGGRGCCGARHNYRRRESHKGGKERGIHGLTEVAPKEQENVLELI